jgi:hypothetical protein
VSVTYLGSKSIGQIAIGISALSLPQLLAFLNELLRQQGDLEARIALYVQYTGVAVTDPATLAAQLEAAILALKDQIAAIVASAIPAMPTINAGVEAELTALLPRLAALQLIYDQLDAAMKVAGVHAFRIDSKPAELGNELQALIGGGIAGGLPNARVQGVMYLTESPATLATLGGVLLAG